MARQTAVEWLVDKVEDFIGLIPIDIIEQAKQMEKEESEYEYKRGWENGAYITRLQNETN
jgi:hypothetical protein